MNMYGNAYVYNIKFIDWNPFMHAGLPNRLLYRYYFTFNVLQNGSVFEQHKQRFDTVEQPFKENRSR